MISQRWPDNFREVMKYEFGISIHGPIPGKPRIDERRTFRRLRALYGRVHADSVSREIIIPRENSVKLPPFRDDVRLGIKVGLRSNSTYRG